MDEFPHYAAVWTQRARRREWAREAVLLRLTCGRHYKQLAASTIQQFVRERSARRRQFGYDGSSDGHTRISTTDSTTGTPVAGLDSSGSSGMMANSSHFIQQNLHGYDGV